MKNLFIASLCLVAMAFIFNGCNSSQPATIIRTIENLKEAYKHEFTASAQYAAFAQKTKEEGMERLSVLFNSVSKAKGIYANNFKVEIEKLGIKLDTIAPVFEVKTTLENLYAAYASESNDFTNVYPQYIKEAKREGARSAIELFTQVQETQKRHSEFYSDANQAITQHWTNAFYTLYYICPTCGNVYYPHKCDNKCAICSTKKEVFIHEG